MSLMKQIPTRQTTMLVMTAKIQARIQAKIRAKTQARIRAGMQAGIAAATAARIIQVTIPKTVIDLSGAGHWDRLFGHTDKPGRID